LKQVKNGKYNPDVAISMAKKMLPDGIGDRAAAAMEKCRGEWDSKLCNVVVVVADTD
jgi:hypothetical protein